MMNASKEYNRGWNAACEATAITLPEPHVYILRTCNPDMIAHGGFVWPVSGLVECPDWKPTAKCGNGLHGLLWGAGDGSHLSVELDARWLVVRVCAAEIVDLDGKVKFPRGEVVHVGDRISAVADIVSRGANPSTCAYSIVTAGDYGSATAGHGGSATAGDGGSATAGYCGSATAGHRGSATAGVCGSATAGHGGSATAGHGGTLIVKFWDTAAQRYRICVGYVGEAGIKPNTPYRVKDGVLVLAR